MDTVERGGHGHHLIHGRTTNLILSAAYKVHSRLGPGLLERPYRDCLSYELRRQGLQVDVERLFPVMYDDVLIQFGYRIDFLVDDTVIVEVKSVEKILPVHEAQLLSYLKLSRRRVGLLFNFNVAHLRDGIRRRVC